MGLERVTEKVNLIKVNYMHVWKIKMKPCVQLIYPYKKEREKKNKSRSKS
jgi:hypothetical protein